MGDNVAEHAAAIMNAINDDADVAAAAFDGPAANVAVNNNEERRAGLTERAAAIVKSVFAPETTLTMAKITWLRPPAAVPSFVCVSFRRDAAVQDNAHPVPCWRPWTLLEITMTAM